MTETMPDTTVRNGVDTTALFATLDAVKADSEIAAFRFRATNRWVSGHAQPVEDPRFLRRQAGDGA